MRVKGWLVGTVMSQMADLNRQKRREQREEQKRQGVPQLHYFHQADDPYSHLMAQVLPILLSQFHLQCVFHLVPPGEDSMVPERAMLEAHARRDARSIAPWYGLSFEEHEHAPRQELVSIAQCIFSFPRTIIDPELPQQVGAALWRDDAIGLQALAGRYGFSDVAASQQALLRGDRLRTRFGHYLGATLYFEGTCYHGIDRVHYLQSRLLARGLLRVEPDALRMILPLRKHGAPFLTLTANGEPGHAVGFASPTRPVVLEFFASLRSPYTYLAMERVMALSQRYRLQIWLRPVLPMVMRGLPVPRRKGAYIMMDSAREAQVLGVPFGKIYDPVGRPVARALSLFDWVRTQGQELAYFHALLRAAFAEGRDIHAKSTLQSIITALGLSWQEAVQRLDNREWQEEVDLNRNAMETWHCWGVPSFILRQTGQEEPLWVAWGQDRLWLIEEVLIKSGLAVPAEITGGA